MQEENDEEIFRITDEPLQDVNAEELHEALSTLCDISQTEMANEEYNGLTELVSRHILYKYQKDGKKTITPTELANELNDLIVSKALENLVKDGDVEALIDEKGEATYRITQSGIQKVDDIMNDD